MSILCRIRKLELCLFLRANLNQCTSVMCYSADAAPQTDENKVEEKKERVFFKDQEIVDGFKLFDVYMNKRRDSPFERRAKRVYTKMGRDKMARYNKMSVDQDWTNVWPTKTMFKQSAVPLPVRQGFIRNQAENEGLPPEKYGNMELVKIPNFLHLTPPHVKKQCAAIKKFCTKWPEELKTDEDCEKHFPIEITTSTYIYDGPSLRDDRARKVTLKIKLSALELDDRSREKFINLVEDRYDRKSDIVTITSERCPYRRQNEEYVNYLLTTCFFESKKVEDWESEMTEADRHKFDWNLSRSKENILNTLSKIDNQASDQQQIINSDTVQTYKTNLTKMFDEGETDQNILLYKQSVLNLLKIKTS